MPSCLSRGKDIKEKWSIRVNGRRIRSFFE